MSDLRTAAQQALDALEGGADSWQLVGPAIDALRAALAEYDKDRVKVEEMKANWDLQRKLAEETQERDRQQRDYEEKRLAALAEPVQKPVAWTYEWKHRLHGGSLNVSRARWPESHLWIETPLYAAPPQRKPLTEEEIDSVWDSEKAFADIYAIVRAIERAHGIV